MLNVALGKLLPVHCEIRSFNQGQVGTQGVIVFVFCLMITCLCVQKLNQKARGTFKTLNRTLTNKPGHGQKQCYQLYCPHPGFDGHSSGVLLPVPGSEGMRKSSAVPVNLIP